MKQKLLFLVVSGIFLVNVPARPGDPDSVYFTNGFRIGEVTPNSAVLWTRLCGSPEPVPVQHPRKEPPFRSPVGFSDTMAVEEMDGAVEGAFGEVKVLLIHGTDTLEWGWETVSSYRDYTLKRSLEGLEPHSAYRVKLLARKGKGAPVARITGSFRTAPPADMEVPVLFTSSSCQYFWDFDDSIRGFRIYDRMIELDPAFHCQTGDYVYYDKPGPMAGRVDLARHKWHAMNSWPSLREFNARVPGYPQKDDHDMMFNDASPGMEPFGELSFFDGLQVWYEQVPLEGDPYRTFRWGKDLQIWVVEGREFRSDNWVEDHPDKTIWGTRQKEWFTRTVEASGATFKVLVSPTPVVGPDRTTGKNDNHANRAFATEGKWLRSFLAQHDVFVINGDRHWQYVSEDPRTGVMEFSQGPSSVSHAQGWSQEDFRPQHKFLRVAGGFLAVSVHRQEGIPVIEFIHFDVDGNEVHRTTLEASSL